MESLGRAFPQVNVSAVSPAKGISDLTRLRLVTGLILVFIALVGLLGFDWDIQWHAVIGRDRTFTPPHEIGRAHV